MRKILICISILSVLILLPGCQREVKYNFLNEQSEIENIEIIMVGEPNDQGVNEQQVLLAIKEKDSFLNEFNQLDCYDHIGDPRGVHPEQLAIKITYNNQEYELIAAGGQAHYTIERQYVNYDGFRYFEKEQFNQFLSQWLKEQNVE